MEAFLRLVEVAVRFGIAWAAATPATIATVADPPALFFEVTGRDVAEFGAAQE